VRAFGVSGYDVAMLLVRGGGSASLVALLAACTGGGGAGGGDDASSDAPLARCGDGHVDANEQCDDGNSDAGDGCTLCMIDADRTAAIDARWRLVTASGAAAACPAAYQTAAVIATPMTGPVVIDLFDCSALMGTTSQLPAALWAAQVAITNSTMSQTFATSLAQVIDLSDATNKPLVTSFVSDGGYFKLAWKLVKMSDPATEVGCDAVSPMSRVKVLAANADPNVPAASTSFPCDGGSTVTSAFIAGTYSVTVSALTNTFATRGSAPALTGQVVTAPDGITDLGTVTIPITGL
jgi:cysteine-rich repeat protein